MRCVLCFSEENIDERGPYPVCAKCALELRENEERIRTGTVLDRDPGPLCMQCGLCCVVLSAEAKPSEVEHLSNWSGKLPTEIAMVEDRYCPGEGKIVLRRPCIFLVGKPTQYVRCRAYETKRPAVCESYLCKLAFRYKAGLCSLNEALFILRASVSRHGDISLFNWSSDPERDKDDHRVATIIVAKRALELLDGNDEASSRLHLAIFEQLHRKFQFASDAHETIFAAMMVNYEGKALALNQFFTEEEISGWSERDRSIAMQTAYQVVGDIRSFFTQESILPKK